MYCKAQLQFWEFACLERESIKVLYVRAVMYPCATVCLSAQTPNIEGDRPPPDSNLLVLVSVLRLTFCLSSSPQITPGGLSEGKHNRWEKGSCYCE